MPPAPPPPPIEDIDPNIPPELARAVAAILAKPDLTDQEIAYAEQLANRCEQEGYVRAAAKLRAKTLAVRGSHAASSLLQQIATVINAPPGSLPQLPVQLPGVPPIVGPGPSPAPTPIPVSPPATPAVAPLAKTYKVVQGDNPSKIAQRFTGSSSATRVRELAAANPDKSGRILAGTIYVGETLTIPDAWPAKPGYAPTSPTPATPAIPAPMTAPHATIQKGSTGPDVALWQTLIGVTADGIFGPNTDAATRTWQSSHGVAADGIVGPVTWAKALATFTTSAVPATPGVIPGVSTIPVSTSVPAPAPSATTHTQIGLGSSGPDVVAWQKIVGVPADGKFGPQTQAATRAWQSAHGLTPDGLVGPKTWTAALGMPSASAGAYLVGPGDTPFKIARRFTGDGNRLIELALTNPEKALRIAQGTLEHGESLHLPPNWPTAAGVYEPDAATGVMDIIGARHHGHHHHNGLGSHRHHG
jgi:peptidoglycan hydrolase-like protein with peptidoglycan-binding domain